ncbi:PPOX class F420-dependent oxidoreductase [soil metagenome]
MSVGQAVNVVPESFNSVLSSKAVGLVGTLSPSGAPQVSPVWYIWNGTSISFQVGTTYQKFKNVQRDPRITLTVVDPENFGRYIEFRGQATIALGRDDLFLSALARKYLDADTLPWETADDTPTIVLIPERIISMDIQI